MTKKRSILKDHLENMENSQKNEGFKKLSFLTHQKRSLTQFSQRFSTESIKNGQLNQLNKVYQSRGYFNQEFIKLTKRTVGNSLLMKSEINSQYDARFRAVLKQMEEYKHQRQIIQETNRMLEIRIQSYTQLTEKEQQALDKIRNTIRLLSANDPLNFYENQDVQKIQKDQEQLTRYQSQLVDQNKIINSTVINLPQKSLQKVASHFAEITEEKVIEMIQYGKETKEVLKSIERTKEKYEKIKDKIMNKTISHKKHSQTDLDFQ